MTVDNPEVIAQAEDCLRAFLAGILDPSELLFGRPRTDAQKMAEAKMRQVLGEPQSIEFAGSRASDRGITTYSFDVAFANAKLEYHFGVKADGTINQFSLKTPPGDGAPRAQLDITFSREERSPS